MRITGGSLRGRLIPVPRSARLRPTQDRVRAALFSILGERVVGSRFADLFAGTGAVGLEAWSRGAAEVCWVEADRRIHATLASTVRDLCGGGRVVGADVRRFLRKGLACGSFDIIFADPPYGAGEGADWLGDLQDAVCGCAALVPGGVFIMEQRAGTPAVLRPGWRMEDERRYGDTALCLMRQEEGAQ